MFTDELRDELESAIARHGRRRRRRTVAVGSLAVLVGVAVLGWWQWGPSETETTDVATSAQERAEAQSERPTSTPEPTVGAEPPVSPLEVPEAPPAEPEAGIDLDLVGTVTVWMGDELFVWGGTEAFGSGTTTASLGATYDPSADSWTPLPPAPGGPQAEAVGVWTGSEVLLCCGTNSGNALGFDPESRRWRELPEPPLADRRPGPGSSWVGGRFVVVGATEMVAYSPVTDTWEVLQPPPVELTVSPAASIVAVGDNELVVWPRQFARRVTSG